MNMIHIVTEAAPRWKKPRRKGRGESSGRGKTCGRGTKGSKARGGKYIKPGYEGGQTPIFRRFPKRGFSNVNFANRYHVINTGDLNVFADGSTVDQATLIEKGLIPDDRLPVKVLAEGELKVKLTVHAGWYSRTAHAAIVKLGGSALNPAGNAFEFPKEKKKFVPRAAEKKSKKGAEEPAAEAPKA